MAFNFRKEGELDRVVGLFKLGTWQEMARLCYRFDAWYLAEQLGLPPARSERQLVREIHEYIASGAYDKPPKCDCELPDGLRWLEGKATYAYDPKGQPDNLDFDPQEQIRKAAKAWMDVCGIELTEVPITQAQIVITWADLDGRGKTLGQAYMPASGEDMSACGGPCGDIMIDWSEPWVELFFYAVFLHELGHAIGIPHAPTSDGSNVLEAYYTGRTDLGPWDIEQAVLRYLKTIKEFRAKIKKEAVT